MEIAFVLYPGMTALDLIGPYEVLAHQEGVAAHFVAATGEPVTADAGLVIAPTTTFGELDRADVVVVPGSSAWERVLADGAVAAWLREVHPTATWTTSVCTGSTLLAEAGILTGRPATTHWAVRDALAARGAVVSTDRVVRDGSVITAAGVSAGIDMALTLVGLIWGDDRAKFTQLVIEYAPEPPYDAGSPETAPAELVAFARSALEGRSA
ncbi:DJ-1/PfpI family protein [Saccharothrix algeriensis]|uniref:DJ-1/PfpI family protein n=1 Tax=Saccharothrix algeriensis TaxID=173560 RepID=A0A8T8I1H0_9PSEU|nr:DJ-1/PfpI family protein [Saccharothrix algeriensis]MBM7809459.1 transcriptional regulator GlxA family with amidase domain [Saccharothrix algeriensis]QTR03794.1 DJ-1/PfpI family protein [Saccharothrix algeriensis]